MDNTWFAEPTPEEAAQMMKEIEQGLAEIQRSRERMHVMQIEIEASQARTDAIMANIQVELAKLRAN